MSKLGFADSRWRIGGRDGTARFGGRWGWLLGSKRCPSTTADATSTSFRFVERACSGSSSKAAGASIEWRSMRMRTLGDGAAAEGAFEIVVLGEAAQDDVD
jgi:hypothetical protein